MQKKFRVVIMGGGTGTARMIAGLKKYPVKISAIISTADNSSSSGTLREQFDMVPPGDMRQCLVALAENKKLAEYFHTRFGKGSFSGHPFGNILLALLYERHKDIQKAVDETCMLLGIREHEVLPATLRPTTLVAKLADKVKITGESNITSNKCLQKKNAGIFLLPKIPSVNPRACEALKRADAILVGPGNLFTSILPALLPQEIQRAFLASGAKKIFVANLMTQKGHTENFSPADLVRTVETYLGGLCFDAIFYNITPISRACWNKNIGCKPVTARKEEAGDVRFIAGKFAKPIKQVNQNDPITSLRSLVVHNEYAIAKKIFAYLNNTHGNDSPPRKK